MNKRKPLPGSLMPWLFDILDKGRPRNYLTAGIVPRPFVCACLIEGLRVDVLLELRAIRAHDRETLIHAIDYFFLRPRGDIEGNRDE